MKKNLKKKNTYQQMKLCLTVVYECVCSECVLGETNLDKDRLHKLKSICKEQSCEALQTHTNLPPPHPTLC